MTEIEQVGGLKESIEFNELWWNGAVEGEIISQDEIDLILEMIAMSKAELEKNATLITTIESLQSELETETKDRRDCEKASRMWQKYSEDQELLVIKRDSIIESQKEEIESLQKEKELLKSELDDWESFGVKTYPSSFL